MSVWPSIVLAPSFGYFRLVVVPTDKAADIFCITLYYLVKYLLMFYYNFTTYTTYLSPCQIINELLPIALTHSLPTVITKTQIDVWSEKYLESPKN